MISSLLDNDFYQFTMCQAIWAYGQDIFQVKYEFRNRTFGVQLASRLDLGLLEKEIDAVRQLRFQPSEIDYLRSTGIFQEEFLVWLPSVRLPEVQVGSENGHLVMTYQGDWGSAIFWETMLLSIVNEMYYDRFGSFTSEGFLRLAEKIAYLDARKTIRFVEFGTRRRYSASWQHLVTHTVRDAIPDVLVGTSNVHLAQELDLRPVGTMAHQLFMVLTALNTQDQAEPIKQGAEQVLTQWGHVYGAHPEMMTVLPDTYTTLAFCDSVDFGFMGGVTAFRQDSGDPILMGQELVRYSLELGIEPKIIFSDGLDVRRMSVIEDSFPGVECLFGWGTNLTNDLGYEPLSIVIKPCAVKSLDSDEWLPCVKISDDIAKATGDPAAIQRYLGEWL